MHSSHRATAPWTLTSGAVTAAFLVVAALGGCSHSTLTVTTPAATIIEGTILTMDDANRTVEAVAIDERGVIVGVGSTRDVRARFLGSGTQVQALGAKEVLMPGLIEPHLHLLAWMQYNGVPVVSPCYPGPYAAGNEPNCSNYIKPSLRNLKPATCVSNGPIIFGLNLDPSRQPYDETTPATAFRANPAQYISQEVCPGQPVLIIDQSGHFGYVNKAAFDGLQAFIAKVRPGSAWPPAMPADAAWALSGTPNAPDNSKYSGLLIEQDAFVPFMEWMAATDNTFIGPMLRDPVTQIDRKVPPVVKGLNLLRAAGITTVTSIADTTTEVQGIAAAVTLAGSPIRAVTNARPPAVDPKPTSNVARPTPPACDPRKDSSCTLPRNLGVTGIKLTADGSSQGCTAGMRAPFIYVATGPCAMDAFGKPNATGRLDYPDAASVMAVLQPYWNTGLWRIESHANGSGAMQLVLDAYARMQLAHPIAHPVTVIHTTIGDPVVYRQAADLRAGRWKVNGTTVPALDVRFTHLIGHVAYWGGAFEQILGVEHARAVDALGTLDAPLGIPYTMHSDAMVSLPRPMWFVQQAVTRTTWFYPALRDADKKVLGPENRISVQEALRAVTISVAREKAIDGWVGSIEPGKVADFVRLSDNPLAYDAKAGGDPSKIVDIRILGTYLNGKATAPLAP